LVSFNLNEEKFEVDILKVRANNKMMQIRKILNSPHYVEGVINLRGLIIHVIETDYITAVGKLENRLLILLDLNKVFNTEQIELLSSMN